MNQWSLALLLYAFCFFTVAGNGLIILAVIQVLLFAYSDVPERILWRHFCLLLLHRGRQRTHHPRRRSGALICLQWRPGTDLVTSLLPSASSPWPATDSSSLLSVTSRGTGLVTSLSWHNDVTCLVYWRHLFTGEWCCHKNDFLTCTFLDATNRSSDVRHDRKWSQTSYMTDIIYL